MRAAVGGTALIPLLASLSSISRRSRADSLLERVALAADQQAAPAARSPVTALMIAEAAVQSNAIPIYEYRSATRPLDSPGSGRLGQGVMGSTARAWTVVYSGLVISRHRGRQLLEEFGGDHEAPGHRHPRVPPPGLRSFSARAWQPAAR